MALQGARAISSLALAIVALVLANGAANLHGPPSIAAAPHASYDSPVASAAAPSPALASADAAGPLSVAAVASPTTVCGYGAPTCPGTANQTRLTLRVAAPPAIGKGPGLPDVQVVFAVETSLLDGSCSPYGISGLSYGSCDLGVDGYVIRNLSMFLPDFVAHSGSMTQAIVAGHPGANVSFGLVDFEQSASFGDGDGWFYHVDIGSFVNASSFPDALNASTFQSAFYDIDLSDNIFRSSSITALYGALEGDGLNWSSDAHHVIVWVGATAPPDPHYPIDMCIGWLATVNLSTCQASTCEPATLQANLESPTNFTIPMCEGWVVSSNGNPGDSIAALTTNSSLCAYSLLNRCTIDTITLPTALTEPNSSTWIYPAGVHSNASALANNSHSVLSAGCDLANATNGSWDGPIGIVCPNGAVGTISDAVNNGSARQAQNATLIAAVANISLGLEHGPMFAQGIPGIPLFRIVLAPGVRPTPMLNLSVSCTASDGSALACDGSVTVGAGTLGWNWSDGPSANALGWGEVWSASFDVTVVAPPNSSVPLDVCAAVGCAPTPSGTQVSGITYWPSGSPYLTFQSFPLVTVAVVPPPPVVVSLVSQTPVIDVGAGSQFSVAVTGGVPPFQLTVDFGDGSNAQWTSLPTTITHAYRSPGQHQAWATAVGGNGTAGSAGAFVTVLYPLSLTLATPGTHMLAGAPGTFSLLVTGGLAPYDVLWQFGDGSSLLSTSGIATAVVHNYTLSGTYVGQVTVADAAGGSSTNPFVIQVINDTSGSAPPPLTATAAADVGPWVGNPCPPNEVSVTLVGSASGGVEPYTMMWTFEDGGPAEFGSSVTHVYVTGTYSAFLTVTDASGATAYAAVNGTVPAVAGPACGVTTTPQGGFGDLGGSLLLVIIGAVLAVVVIASIILVARRRP